MNNDMDDLGLKKSVMILGQEAFVKSFGIV